MVVDEIANFLIGWIYRREYGERIKRFYPSRINRFNRKAKMYILKIVAVNQNTQIRKSRCYNKAPIHYIDVKRKRNYLREGE